MSKKPHVHEVYLIRALAMLGVIAVHGTSFTTVDLAGHSDFFWIYQILNRFGKLGTPVFIFLSSFVLFYNYANRKLDKPLLKRFYSRRLNFILVPYLCWTIFYFFFNGFYVDHYIYSREFLNFFSWKDLMIDLLYGKAHAHLYFVVINIQFYILFPLFLWLLGHARSWGKHLVWIGFAVQWLFYIANHFWISEFAFKNDLIYYKGSVFLSYMAYFGLGAFIGTHFTQFKQWIQKTSISIFVWAGWLIAGAFYTWLYYEANVYKKWYHSFWYEFGWNMYTLISCLALFHLSILLMRWRKSPVVAWLSRLGGVTFGIYLVHPVILLLWRMLPFSNQIFVYHAQVWLGMAAALFASWLIVAGAHKLSPKLHSILFGQRSAPDPNLAASTEKRR